MPEQGTGGTGAGASRRPRAGAGPPLRLVFWETTKGCNLRCRHCRAVPEAERSAVELTTADGRALVDAIAEVATPVLVFSGGEPLFRPDVFELGAYARARGFRIALATNGTLVTREVAERIRDTGFSRVSISLDGARAETHDAFRGFPGSFAGALRAAEFLRACGVSVQINSTVARHNVAELPDLLALAVRIGADALHIFMLVPVGCGVTIADREMLPAADYERVLHWFYEQSKTCDLDLKATCAPHYFRIRAERILDERRRGDFTTRFVAPGTARHAAPDPAGGPPLSAMTRGCLAGTAVCFVSHAGDVYPCGYLPVSAGNVRRQRFAEIWRDAAVFRALRDPSALTGKCGRCRYEAICGGCRARAYAETGDYLAGEPFCLYEPPLEPRPAAAGVSLPG